MKLSVLMSVYNKEKPQNLNECLVSLVEQTRMPDQIVIVCDGILSDELNSVLTKYQQSYPNLIEIVQLDKNYGLGVALNRGLDKCEHEYVARMDSDDICEKNRFELQMDYMHENNNVDVLGSYISEFIDGTEDIVSVREVPLNTSSIKRMALTRSPMNHVSVVFRKSRLIGVSAYSEQEPVEDYDLWIRLLLDGACFANMERSLVKVRIGKDMYARRGNSKYIRSWMRIQNRLVKNNDMTRWRWLINAILITVFVYMPPGLKSFMYKSILRKRKNNV